MVLVARHRAAQYFRAACPDSLVVPPQPGLLGYHQTQLVRQRDYSGIVGIMHQPHEIYSDRFYQLHVPAHFGVAGGMAAVDIEVVTTYAHQKQRLARWKRRPRAPPRFPRCRRTACSPAREPRICLRRNAWKPQRGWARFSSQGTEAAALMRPAPDQARPAWKR